MRRSKERSRFIFLCVAPATILFFIFMVLPTLNVFRMSLFERGAYSPTETFVGLNNFKVLFKDAKFISAMQNTILLIATVTIITFFFAILFAAILTREKIKGQNFFRVIFYIPNILSVVVIAGIFSAIYKPENGMLNSILSFFKGETVMVLWKDQPMVIISVIIAMHTAGRLSQTGSMARPAMVPAAKSRAAVRSSFFSRSKNAADIMVPHTLHSGRTAVERMEPELLIPNISVIYTGIQAAMPSLRAPCTAMAARIAPMGIPEKIPAPVRAAGVFPDDTGFMADTGPVPAYHISDVMIPVAAARQRTALKPFAARREGVSRYRAAVAPEEERDTHTQPFRYQKSLSVSAIMRTRGGQSMD